VLKLTLSQLEKLLFDACDDLRGMPHADIRRKDTIRRPQHKNDNGELRPSTASSPARRSARTTRAKTSSTPAVSRSGDAGGGQKADPMFVQHMLARYMNEPLRIDPADSMPEREPACGLSLRVFIPRPPRS
jgi:hypothetical protein